MAKAICSGYCPSPFCVAACPVGAIFIRAGNKNIQLDVDKCHGCGICRVVCITFSRDKGLEKKMPWARGRTV